MKSVKFLEIPHSNMLKALAYLKRFIIEEPGMTEGDGQKVKREVEGMEREGDARERKRVAEGRK